MIVTEFYGWVLRIRELNIECSLRHGSVDFLRDYGPIARGFGHLYFEVCASGIEFSQLLSAEFSKPYDLELVAGDGNVIRLLQALPMSIQPCDDDHVELSWSFCNPPIITAVEPRELRQRHFSWTEDGF